MVFQQTGGQVSLPEPEGAAAVDWFGRLQVRPSEQQHLTKPRNWRRYPFPFIYGQTDPKLFPVSTWRMCSRQAPGVAAIPPWTAATFHDDDPRPPDNNRHPTPPPPAITAPT